MTSRIIIMMTLEMMMVTRTTLREREREGEREMVDVASICTPRRNQPQLVCLLLQVPTLPDPPNRSRPQSVCFSTGSRFAESQSAGSHFPGPTKPLLASVSVSLQVPALPNPNPQAAAVLVPSHRCQLQSVCFSAGSRLAGPITKQSASISLFLSAGSRFAGSHHAAIRARLPAGLPGRGRQLLPERREGQRHLREHQGGQSRRGLSGQRPQGDVVGQPLLQRRPLRLQRLVTQPHHVARQAGHEEPFREQLQPRHNHHFLLLLLLRRLRPRGEEGGRRRGGRPGGGQGSDHHPAPSAGRQRQPAGFEDRGSGAEARPPAARVQVLQKRRPLRAG